MTKKRVLILIGSVLLGIVFTNVSAARAWWSTQHGKGCHSSFAVYGKYEKDGNIRVRFYFDKVYHKNIIPTDIIVSLSAGRVDRNVRFLCQLATNKINDYIYEVRLKIPKQDRSKYILSIISKLSEKVSGAGRGRLDKLEPWPKEKNNDKKPNNAINADK